MTSRFGRWLRDPASCEAAKREAAFVLDGHNAEISKEEIICALRAMHARWQTPMTGWKLDKFTLYKRPQYPRTGAMSTLDAR